MENAVTAVTVTPIAGKTDGKIDIYYTKADGTGKTMTVPQEAGSYTISIDVAAATGFSSVKGLVLNAVLVVNKQGNPNDKTPSLADYTVSPPTPGQWKYNYDGQPKVVSVAKANADAPAAVVNYRGSATAPTAIGVYVITLVVAPVTGWNGITLSYTANALEIVSADEIIGDKEPTASDFVITGLGPLTYNGAPQPVSIKWREDDSISGILIKYNGSETAPSNAGTYPVTFDVAARTGWTEASGLSAGSLVIASKTPIATDFALNVISDRLGSVSVEIVAASGVAASSPGARTIKYGDDLLETPNRTGPFNVIVDVAAAPNYNAATNLLVGFIDVLDPYPEFKFGNLTLTPAGGSPVVTDVSDQEAFGFETPLVPFGVTYTTSLQVKDQYGNTLPMYVPPSGSTPATPGDYTIAWKLGDTATTTFKEVGTYTGTVTVRTAGPNDLDANYQPKDVTFIIGRTFLPTVFAYFWLDEHGNLINDLTINNNSVHRGEPVVISARDPGYEVVEWRVDGRVYTGETLTFVNNNVGMHIVSLIVSKDGWLYNTNINIEVK